MTKQFHLYTQPTAWEKPEAIFKTIWYSLRMTTRGREDGNTHSINQLPLPSDPYLPPLPLPSEGQAPCPASLLTRVLVSVPWTSIWIFIVTQNSSHSLESGLPPCLQPPCPTSTLSLFIL